ncbi:MAG: ABC-2 family transporter protein [Oligoflexia bacterium]|nr:ABC-2 family transporter protein [Oligoflexia bacterium]
MQNTIKGSFLFFAKLVSLNIQAPMALRTSFLMQVIFMLLNNLVYFTVWWIFFTRFKEINGWGLAEIEAMYALTAASFGTALVFGAGARQIALKIVHGELDTYLVQPKNPLLHQVGSLSQPSGWGDMITATVLLYMSGYGTLVNIPMLLLFVFCGASFFLATAIIANSLAFWLGHVDQLARQILEFVITFSVYPQNIFPAGFKVILFTILPAGFISYLPIEILKSKNYLWIFGLVAACAFYLALAQFIFYRGLRRYESGNKIG